LSSAAFVAVITHDDPASPGVRVVPEMVHVPLDTAYDTAPVPLPPEVVRDSAWPYVAVVEVTVSTDCATRAIVNVPLFFVSA